MRVPELPPPVVCVADDDDEMRAVVASSLAALGYEVWQASDGRELLDQLLEGAARGTAAVLVVSDVAMPRLTGPRACAAARSAGLSIPFIFMTAFVSAGGRSAAEAAGAVAVFDKPFDLDDLVAAVRLHAGPVSRSPR
ncbi:MAG: response regulator [Deltaproteobacteria bacterium]|jgi:CheY-like chemotaxis protein|nr:response regulator [Deltaproteobacteria bacterium]MBW2537779.1 response regulator [Deltaproteobacteria bacterium]